MSLLFDQRNYVKDNGRIIAQDFIDTLAGANTDATNANFTNVHFELIGSSGVVSVVTYGDLSVTSMGNYISSRLDPSLSPSERTRANVYLDILRDS